MLSYESPAWMEGGVGAGLTVGSLLLIVIGAVASYRSQASATRARHLRYYH